MITARLHGRLGNQMFQYAAARALAERHNVGVALDTRVAVQRGEGVLTRVFDLDVVTDPKLPPAKHQSLTGYALWRYLGRGPRYVRERGLGFNSGFAQLPDEVYLHGYWQSQRYFDAIADRIRSDFTFPDIRDPQNAEMAVRIGETLSIALHVRRGDYVGLQAHVLCDQAYYEAALVQMTDGLSAEPTVFVFSDDPDWAKAHLPLPHDKVVVDFNGPDADFEDMRLMSLCNHNIIGNSSFSWWGAWLNPTPAKRVAGPARWFGDPKLRNPDILPPDWYAIEV